MESDRQSHRVVLDIGLGQGADAGPPRADEPFCIAVLGDFSGRGARRPRAGEPPLAERRSALFDPDTADAVLAALAPSLDLELPAVSAAPLSLRFTELDDFHPDRLYDVVRRAGAPAAPAAGGGSLLDQMLDAAPVAAAPAAAATIQASVRAVLHHPAFQSLESLWRSVHLLLRRVDTGARLRLYLVDVGRAELAAALPDDGDPRATAPYRLLARGPSDLGGAARWSLLVGCYSFGADGGDASLLGRLARVAEAVGAPWLAAAHPAIVGAGSLAGDADPDDWSRGEDPAWTAFRRSAAARWVALALPRFLLRAPYGRDGEECERFPFEELASDQPAHEQLLWGNPAVLLALPFAAAVADALENERRGRDLRPEAHLEIAGLPLHVLRTPHGAQALAAEALLSDRAVERVLERGPVPVMQRRDSDTVRLTRLQSMAASGAGLAGRWWSS